MKVKVKVQFRDKFITSRLYQEGDVVDFDRERAEHVVELGLAEPYAEPSPVKKTTRKKK